MAERHVIGPASEIPSGTGKVYTVKGRQLAVFNLGGTFYAIDDECPHEGGCLSEGALTGTTLMCPLHAAEFNVTTGKLLCGPAAENVPTWPTRVVDGRVEVTV